MAQSSFVATSSGAVSACAKPCRPGAAAMRKDDSMAARPTTMPAPPRRPGAAPTRAAPAVDSVWKLASCVCGVILSGAGGIRWWRTCTAYRSPWRRLPPRRGAGDGAAGSRSSAWAVTACQCPLVRSRGPGAQPRPPRALHGEGWGGGCCLAAPLPVCLGRGSEGARGRPPSLSTRRKRCLMNGRFISRLRQDLGKG